jgi:RecB family exonuclease
LRLFMIELQNRFAAATGSRSGGMADPAHPRTWGSLGSWTLDLFHALIPAADLTRMPIEEQYAAGVLERTLNGLAALDETGVDPDLEGLEQILALELESALPRVGRFGEGVLVAPVTQAIGLDLDVVYLVGLSEDLLPGRLGDDSLLPERVRAMSGGQLASTRARVEIKHRSLLAAFSSATLVVASFPRGDLRRHTNRLPSRWLLPTLRRLSNIPALAATDWHRATTVRPPGERLASGVWLTSAEWLVTSHSYAGSLLTTDEPSTAQEWRIRAAAARAVIDEPAILASLSMSEDRASNRFTRFDGNLMGRSGLPDFLHGAHAVSPTSLERYAICPHEYFVKRMLHVEPVEAPEEALEISALDIGSLIHECFDELISGCAKSGELPDYGQPWSSAQRQRLQEIALTRAAAFEAEGRTGHPLLWTRARTRILADLDWMLSDDNAWRAEQDARVVASELAFGMHGEPEVEIAVDEGIVRFRGSADKVDERRDGTLLVTDIKSGSIRTFKDLSETNPVAHGEKLQLPVYAQAARARYGTDATEVEAMYWFVRKDRGKRPQVPLTDAVQRRYSETVGLLVRSLANGVFPERAPEKPDFRLGWVQCPYCNPDGLGHNGVRRRWEAKRGAPELVDYTSLVEPDALAPTGFDDQDGGDR